mgnify:CR=1 FL=1
MLRPYFKNTTTQQLSKRLTRFLLVAITAFAVYPKAAYAAPLEDERELISLNATNSSFDVALFYEKTGNPKGGVILTYSHANTPFYLNNIAYVLARHGWSTVLVGASKNKVLPSEETDDDKEDPPTYSAKLSETIRFMREEKGQNNLVILAQGSIWGKVKDYISDAENDEDIFQGLVLLDIKQPGNLKNLPINLPLLDLTTARLPSSDFHQRKIEANRYKFSSYTQVNLPSRLSLTSLKEDHLAKRIRGWLKLNI